MKAQESQFLTFLEGKKQFIIPIYQRTYSWTHEQCEQLWNDIVRVATDKGTATHFIGSIVYIQQGVIFAGRVMPLLVIDGQQRMTTLALLLIALARAVKDAPVARNLSHEDIYESYLINKFCSDEHYYKLLLTRSDKDTLIALTDDPDHAKLTLPAHRLLENYLYFENLICQGTIDPYTLYTGISKLMIVEISLNKDHDNPQLIFESLNSTGMDLSQADLIRNYVLMGLGNEEQSRLYKTYWYPMEQCFRRTDRPNSFDRFMRDYLTLKQGGIPKVDEVYSSFKTYYRNLGSTPVSQLIADIERYASYFVKMAFLQEEDVAIRSVVADMNTLKVDVVYPFLLEVYDDYAHKLLSSTAFIAILKLVESYVLRRVICGVPPNSLNKTFATLAKEIDKDRYLESVQAVFLKKDSRGRFPKDEEFRAEFMVKDIYNLRIRNYILRKLENHGSKESVNIEEYTIEHIMPQHLSPQWQEELGPTWKEIHARYLHTIGNLTLTGYNLELSNHPFREKRDHKEGGFAKSPIRLNRSLAEVEHWNEEEIKKRAEALADLAVQIWTMPQVHKSPNQPQREVSKEVLSSKDQLHSEKGVQVLPKKNPLASRNGGAGATHHVKLTDNTGSSSLEDHLRYMPVNIRGIFERLRKRILNLDSSVKEEVRKHAIVYKTTTDFVTIELQKKQLRLTLHVRLSEMNDPKGLCKIITHSGHLNNGEAEISIHSLDQIEDGMELIRQAFEKHTDEVYA